MKDEHGSDVEESPELVAVSNCDDELITASDNGVSAESEHEDTISDTRNENTPGHALHQVGDGARGSASSSDEVTPVFTAAVARSPKSLRQPLHDVCPANPTCPLETPSNPFLWLKPLLP